MEAYLDNSATTRCSESVRDIMLQVMMEDYGNPSSLHLMGKKAEDYIKEAREKIAKTLKVTEKEIVFTSGGTESNNLAIIGSAMANQRAGKHIITTAIEHASVAAVVSFLEEQGFEGNPVELRFTYDGSGLAPAVSYTHLTLPTILLV